MDFKIPWQVEKGSINVKGTELKEYIIRDNQGNVVLNSFDKDFIEEIVKRVNEYEELKKQEYEGRVNFANIREELVKLQALNRELVEQLEVIKSTYEMGYTLNDNMVKDIEKVLEKADGVTVGKITSKSPTVEEVTTEIKLPKLSSPYNDVPLHRALIKDDEHVYCTNCHYFRLDDEDIPYCRHENKCNINNPEDSRPIEERPFYKEK